MDNPTKRALNEIRSSLKGRYDREVVRAYLREDFRLNIEKRNAERGETVSRAVIDAQVEQGAAEVEKIIWDGLDSALAMGVKALWMTAASVYLQPIAQRIGASESKVREAQEAKKDVRDQIVNAVLTPWLERFSPLFSQAGRPPKSDDQKEREASEKEQELEALRVAIDEIIEEWTKKEDQPEISAAILREKLRRKGFSMGARTLTRRLGELGMTMQRVKKSRAK
jgi:hypothetical protein